MWRGNRWFQIQGHGEREVTGEFIYVNVNSYVALHTEKWRVVIVDEFGA
jgi:hypothetical protein